MRKRRPNNYPWATMKVGDSFTTDTLVYPYSPYHKQYGKFKRNAKIKDGKLILKVTKVGEADYVR